MTAETMIPMTSSADTPIAVGDLRVIAREADAAPTELGGVYEQILAGAINDSGEVAFSARLAASAADSAMMLIAGGAARTLLRAGDAAPCGGCYRAFGQLDLGDGGFLLFHATLAGGAASEGVFLSTPDGVRTVALAGGAAPDGQSYRSFDQLTLVSGIFDGRPFYTLAFVATMADGKKSVILDPCGKAQAAAEVLVTGDQLDTAVVEDLAISRLGLSLCCIARMRRARRVYNEAILLHDRLIMHGDVLREGRRLPQAGKIARLLAPAAVNLQTGFVALEFADRRGGLATLESRGDTQVFVQTGDPAPGIHGARLQHFGSVVSNSGVPPLGRFGVASAVELSDGRAALWVGAFKQKIPFVGAAIVPLIEGDRTDDERGLVVRAFTPVKLTNRGALLLRGTLERGGAAREGLLLLDGLFDWLPG
jgi:hypothetical protein